MVANHDQLRLIIKTKVQAEWITAIATVALKCAGEAA